MSLKDIGRYLIENFDIRYIIRGVIDGSLSSLGVIIGASGGDVSLIITAGVGGGVANGISNILGALTAERAIVESVRMSQERVLLREEGYLKSSQAYKEALNRTTISGIWDGLSTTFGSIIPITPFFFFPKEVALFLAVVITTVILFTLGVFIGKISKENLILSGFKMAAVGLLVALISFVIENML